MTPISVIHFSKFTAITSFDYLHGANSALTNALQLHSEMQTYHREWPRCYHSHLEMIWVTRCTTTAARTKSESLLCEQMQKWPSGASRVTLKHFPNTACDAMCNILPASRIHWLFFCGTIIETASCQQLVECDSARMKSCNLAGEFSSCHAVKILQDVYRFSTQIVR